MYFFLKRRTSWTSSLRRSWRSTPGHAFLRCRPAPPGLLIHSSAPGLSRGQGEMAMAVGQVGACCRSDSTPQVHRQPDVVGCPLKARCTLFVKGSSTHKLDGLWTTLDTPGPGTSRDGRRAPTRGTSNAQATPFIFLTWASPRSVPRTYAGRGTSSAGMLPTSQCLTLSPVSTVSSAVWVGEHSSV